MLVASHLSHPVVEEDSLVLHVRIALIEPVGSNQEQLQNSSFGSLTVQPQSCPPGYPLEPEPSAHPPVHAPGEENPQSVPGRVVSWGLPWLAEWLEYSTGLF